MTLDLTVVILKDQIQDDNKSFFVFQIVSDTLHAYEDFVTINNISKTNQPVFHLLENNSNTECVVGIYVPKENLYKIYNFEEGTLGLIKSLKSRSIPLVWNSGKQSYIITKHHSGYDI